MGKRKRLHLGRAQNIYGGCLLRSYPPMQTSTTFSNTQYVDNALSERSAEIDPFLQSAGVTELFHTPDQHAYATILHDGHAEHWLLASRTFRLWLRNHLFRLSGAAPSDRMIGQHLHTME